MPTLTSGRYSAAAQRRVILTKPSCNDLDNPLFSNVAYWPQQINTATAAGPNPEQYAQARAHGKQSEPEQNKLLEAEHGQPRQRMDTRAAQEAERSYQEVETVEQVHRAKKPKG